MSADCSTSARSEFGTRTIQWRPSVPVTSAESKSLFTPEPNRLAAWAFSPSTAEVANAARVRWDLAIPDRVGRHLPPGVYATLFPAPFTRLAAHARPVISAALRAGNLAASALPQRARSRLPVTQP